MPPLSIHIATGCGSAFSSLFVITFMHGIYSYTYVWNQAYLWIVKFCNYLVIAICVTRNRIFHDKRFYSTSRYTRAVPTMTVFCSSLMSFPVVLLRYFVSLMWFELPLSLLISLVFTIHMFYLYCIIP